MFPKELQDTSTDPGFCFMWGVGGAHYPRVYVYMYPQISNENSNSLLITTPSTSKKNVLRVIRTISNTAVADFETAGKGQEEAVFAAFRSR
jgi:hypothetical protein